MTLEENPKPVIRNFWKDAAVLVVYKLMTGLFWALFTVGVEMKFLNVSFDQWVGIRIIFNALSVGSASHLRGFEKNLEWRLERRIASERTRKALACSIALSTTQPTLWAIAALMVDVALQSIAIAFAIYFAQNFLMGWTYGPIAQATDAKLATHTES